MSNKPIAYVFREFVGDTSILDEYGIKIDRCMQSLSKPVLQEITEVLLNQCSRLNDIYETNMKLIIPSKYTLSINDILPILEHNKYILEDIIKGKEEYRFIFKYNR